MGQGGHLDSQERKEHSKQRRGAYKLSNIFDKLIHTRPSTASRSSYKITMLSGRSCQSEEAASLAVKLKL